MSMPKYLVTRTYEVTCEISDYKIFEAESAEAAEEMAEEEQFEGDKLNIEGWEYDSRTADFSMSQQTDPDEVEYEVEEYDEEAIAARLALLDRLQKDDQPE
jgi:hypothetical protein